MRRPGDPTQRRGRTWPAGEGSGACSPPPSAASPSCPPAASHRAGKGPGDAAPGLHLPEEIGATCRVAGERAVGGSERPPPPHPAGRLQGAALRRARAGGRGRAPERGRAARTRGERARGGAGPAGGCSRLSGALWRGPAAILSCGREGAGPVPG